MDLLCAFTFHKKYLHPAYKGLRVFYTGADNIQKQLVSEKEYFIPHAPFFYNGESKRYLRLLREFLRTQHTQENTTYGMYMYDSPLYTRGTDTGVETEELIAAFLKTTDADILLQNADPAESCSVRYSMIILLAVLLEEVSYELNALHTTIAGAEKKLLQTMGVLGSPDIVGEYNCCNDATATATGQSTHPADTYFFNTQHATEATNPLQAMGVAEKPYNIAGECDCHKATTAEPTEQRTYPADAQQHVAEGYNVLEAIAYFAEPNTVLVSNDEALLQQCKDCGYLTAMPENVTEALDIAGLLQYSRGYVANVATLFLVPMQRCDAGAIPLLFVKKL